MADSDFFNVTSSQDQIRNNYEQFKDKFVDKDKDLISQETFLKLLVAEMSNQDPLEPTSNTEFISQLAQFSSMQYAQDSSKYAMANYATSLVGKTVTASKMDGPDLVMKTGVVEKVVAQNNTYIVTIDGQDFDIGKVTSVVEPGTSAAIGSSNALADRIIKASQMVGMYATIKTGEDEEGKDILEEGFIASIKVKDGNIKALVNEKEYDIDKIVEVTLATVVQNPENPEKPDDPDAPAAPETPGTGSTETPGTTEDEKAEAKQASENIPDIPDIPETQTGSKEEQELIDQLRELIDSMS